jgi:LPXTG-site transpeptidase (sortase) family protein
VTIAHSVVMRASTAIRRVAPLDGIVGRLRGGIGSARRRVSRGGRTRRVVLVVAAALVGFVVCDVTFGELVHDRRQGQLAADYKVRRPWVSEGRALAVMQIEKIDFNEVVVEGVRPEDLRSGPSHWRGTPDPGKPGNSVILGHHRRFSGPFSRLGELLPGDAIVVKRKGIPFAVSYTVTEVLRDVPDSQASELRLTLVSSESGWLRAEHLVVVATAPLAAAPVAPIDNDAAPVQPDSFDPGDDPIFNRDAVLGGLWLALAVAALGYTRVTYPRRVTIVVVGPLAALGGVYGWLALGRLLQPTL